MVLVDTSVWVESFRKSPFQLESQVSLDEVVTCLPVIQEVLQGFDDQWTYSVARDALLALPIVESPLTVEVFEEAVDLYRTARRAGFTIRSGVDCIIAACAIRNFLSVLHKDRDYGKLSQISPLQSREITI